MANFGRSKSFLRLKVVTVYLIQSLILNLKCWLKNQKFKAILPLIHLGDVELPHFSMLGLLSLM